MSKANRTFFSFFVVSFIVLWILGWWLFSKLPPPKYKTVCVTEYWLERRLGRDKFLGTNFDRARELAGNGYVYSKQGCFKVEK